MNCRLEESKIILYYIRIYKTYVNYHQFNALYQLNIGILRPVNTHPLHPGGQVFQPEYDVDLHLHVGETIPPVVHDEIHLVDAVIRYLRIGPGHQERDHQLFQLSDPPRFDGHQVRFIFGFQDLYVFYIAHLFHDTQYYAMIPAKAWQKTAIRKNGRKQPGFLYMKTQCRYRTRQLIIFVQ